MSSVGEGSSTAGATISGANHSLVLSAKILGIATGIVLFISLIMTGVRGVTHDSSYYLLTCNLILSCFICFVLIWWYRSGSMPEEKIWFFFVLFAAVLLQCITTDIYLFTSKVVPTPLPPPSTNFTTGRPTPPPPPQR